MLVLTRKIGESIQIGNEVTIEVLAVHGSRVRLGITASRSIGVHRAELLVDATAGPSRGRSTRPVPSTAPRRASRALVTARQ